MSAISKRDKSIFFRVQKGEVEEVTSISPSLFERFLKKKILILAREDLIFISRVFPPLSKRDLTQAVTLEAEAYSPYQKFNFFYLTSQTENKKILVHLWIWNQTLVEDILREGFYPTHIIPEDLLFTTSKPTLILIRKEQFLHVIVLTEGKFINSVLIPSTPPELERFIRTLKNFRPEEIILYREIPQFDDRFLYQLFPEALPAIKRKSSLFRDLPRLLKELSLGQFKVQKRRTMHVPEASLILLRVIVYLLLAGSVYYGASAYSYRAETEKLNIKIEALEKEIQALKQSAEVGNATEDFRARLSEFTEELKTKEAARINGLVHILNKLGQVLPDQAYIRSLELRERRLSISIVAQDAVQILENLRKISDIKDLKVPSPPIYDRTRNLYTLRVDITL